MNQKFSASVEFLSRAESVIPLGSQTFSKSRIQYPPGIAPLFATKGKGAYLWDVDGNKYIDLVSNLASVTLGYACGKIDRKVRRQLRNGVGLSLPARLETEVAEKIVELVPSAEKVRFGKNGTDATSAAIRLSRAYTNRDLVVVCGYHGWQDWYIGSTSRNKGVPKTVSDLTLKFEYNDIQSLKRLFENNPNQIACVILEPMNSAFPREGFLEEVIKLCEQNGSVCIFDETITGFRFSNGGAQKYFGVKPHLSTFGKGIANGYPLSAVCGKSEIMDEMNNIFFSGTFGGELLSLAAANAVLDLHINDEIAPALISKGEFMNSEIKKVIEETEATELINLTGHPTWKFVLWKSTEEYSVEVLKTYFLQEAMKRSLLVLSTHNITLAHSEKITNKVVAIYREILLGMKNLIANQTLMDKLEVNPIVPVFKVR